MVLSNTPIGGTLKQRGLDMFSDYEDYEDVESTGYESYGEPGYSSMFSHWHDDDDYNVNVNDEEEGM